MKFYLAARYSRREEMARNALELAELGLGTTECAWLSGDHEWDGSQEPGEQLARAQQFALDDLRDLMAADIVVVFTEQPASGGRNRGGRHVEYGLALAGRKHVLIVGPAENVFHTLPFVPRYADWPGAVAHIVTVVEKARSAAIRKRLVS